MRSLASCIIGLTLVGVASSMAANFGNKCSSEQECLCENGEIVSHGNANFCVRKDADQDMNGCECLSDIFGLVPNLKCMPGIFCDLDDPKIDGESCTYDMECSSLACNRDSRTCASIKSDHFSLFSPVLQAFTSCISCTFNS